MAEGDPPEVFRAVLAGLEEVVVATAAGSPFRHCFGCGPEHPTGLRVRCFRVPGGVVSPIVIASRHAGPAAAAHGGIVATYLDEVLGGAAAAGGPPAVTGELTVRYVRPVPLETPLLGRGRLVADHGRYVDVEGSLETLARGEVVATARGRYFPVAR